MGWRDWLNYLIGREPVWQPPVLSDNWIEASAPNVGVRMTIPDNCQLMLGPLPDGTGENTAAVFGITGGMGILMLTRGSAVPVEDERDHAWRTLTRRVEETASRGAYVVAERPIWIGEVPGHLSETGMRMDQFNMRAVDVIFVLNGHEYEWTLGGDKRFIDPIREPAMRIITSVRPA